MGASRHDEGWPPLLYVLRHGESAGNVARDRAEASGAERIDIAERDMDVPLSELGQRQAAAVGRWFAARPVEERPTLIYASPYVRARTTAEILAREGLAGDAEVVVDERLREREFGILDRLTHAGIVALAPMESERRAQLGKFYHRPPGGESWCDVALRMRSFLDSLTREAAGERVLLATHEVVVKICRYLLERLSEDELLAIDRGTELVNCSLTTYVRAAVPAGRPALALQTYNDSEPASHAGDAVTASEDVPVGPH